jgi:hypothetical protein
MQRRCTHCLWGSPVVLTVVILLALIPGWGCATDGYEESYAAGAALDPLAPGSAYDIDFFYNELAPYGEWFQEPTYGWVWHPVGMAPGWRPYTLGHWVYTNESGWTWVSDLDWGWACFHYGRWWLNDNLGWVWIPGRVWGPAWCAWRYGDGWIGWAPLPPSVAWSDGVGIGFSAHWDNLIGHREWVFVHDRDFLRPHLRDYLEHSVHNVNIIGHTNDVTRLDYDHGRIMNHSFDRERIERFVGHPVRRYALRDMRDLDEWRHGRGGGREVRMFRPRISGNEAHHEPPFFRPGREESDEEMQARHEAERRAMNDWLDREGSDLHRRHEEERLHSHGYEPRELQRRHDLESHELREMRDRNSRRMESRHERERSGRSRRGH